METIEELANQEKLFVALEIFEEADKRNDRRYKLDKKSPLVTFLEGTKKYPALSKKEETALVNDPEKEKKLIMYNLRKMAFIAGKFAYRLNDSIDVMDLIQEGFFGLRRAAQKFEFNKGYRFNTYAKWWIRHKILRYLHDNGRFIRIPAYINRLLNRLTKVEVYLKQEFQRRPSDEELAQGMDITIKKFRALKDIRSVISLSSPAYNHRDEEDGDMIEQFILDKYGRSPEEEVLTSEGRKDIWLLAQQVFAGIKDGERLFYVLEQRHAGDGRTLEDIGEELGLSRQRVSQLEILALKKFRPYKIRKQFEQFR